MRGKQRVMCYKLIKIFSVLSLTVIFTGCYTFIRILDNDRRIGSTGKINTENIRDTEFIIEDKDWQRGYYCLDIIFDPADIELLRALHRLEEPVNFEFDILDLFYNPIM